MIAIKVPAIMSMYSLHRSKWALTRSQSRCASATTFLMLPKGFHAIRSAKGMISDVYEVFSMVFVVYK